MCTPVLPDYKFNTFLIAPHILRTTFGPRSRLLRPKPQHARKIQHLVLRIATCFPYVLPPWCFSHYTHNELVSILERPIYPWSFLLTFPSINSVPDEAVSVRAEWRCDFSSLKTFTVDLQLAGEYRFDLPPRLALLPSAVPSACICRSRNDVVEVLACGSINIKAKKVMVTVTVEDCRSGACAFRLEKLLRAILRGRRMDLGV
jgi:hypothetical protein